MFFLNSNFLKGLTYSAVWVLQFPAQLNEFLHNCRPYLPSFTLGEHLSSKTACLRWCVFTLVAFVLTFLHCVFSNESSNDLLEMRHSRIGCICVTFLLHYWFSQGNININPSFTNIIIFNMLIHHNQVGNVPWKSFSTTSALSPEMRPLSRVSL